MERQYLDIFVSKTKTHKSDRKKNKKQKQNATNKIELSSLQFLSSTPALKSHSRQETLVPPRKKSWVPHDMKGGKVILRPVTPDIVEKGLE